MSVICYMLIFLKIFMLKTYTALFFFTIFFPLYSMQGYSKPKGACWSYIQVKTSSTTVLLPYEKHSTVQDIKNTLNKEYGISTTEENFVALLPAEKDKEREPSSPLHNSSKVKEACKMYKTNVFGLAKNL